uniref:hypothetical protein n=1 Tax=Lachnospira sp. TaxID=2049031 RepID=UPI003FEF3AC2
MIKRNLLKGAAVFLSCCLIFASAGCGKKKPVSTENTTKAVTEQETKDNKKKTTEEQVTIAVKDAEGNTVEVAGIVETNEDGEKVVIIQDRDGNRTEIKADNYEESGSGTITITDETVSNEITEAAKDDKIPKADEVIPTKPSTDDVVDNGNNSGGSSGSPDNNNGGNSSGNNGSSSSDNSGNTTPSEPETKPSTPDTPSHEHNWEPVYDYIPHEEVKENVWVVDKAAWEEPVYSVVFICLQCEHNECEHCIENGINKAEFSSYEELDNHLFECIVNGGSCSNSTTRKKITDYIHHDEEGHYETVTISEAYTEKKLVGYRCSSCGETKSN